MKKLFLLSCMLMLQHIHGMDEVGMGVEQPKGYNTISLAQWGILYNVAHCKYYLDSMKTIIKPLSKPAKKRVIKKVAEEHQNFLNNYTPTPIGDLDEPQVKDLKKFFKRHKITFRYKKMLTEEQFFALQRLQRMAREEALD